MLAHRQSLRAGKRTLSIVIEIAEKHPPNHAIDPVRQFMDQHIKLFEDSKKHGDLTLLIFEENKEYDDELMTNPLNAKRRRIGDEGQSSSDAISTQSKEPSHMRTYSSVLRSASSVFEAELDKMKGKRQKYTLDIRAVNVEDVDDMLLYLMVGHLRKEANPRTLIRIAHLYKLKGLFAACSERIISDLTVDTFMESLAVINRYEIEHVLDRLIKFGKEHMTELQALESFNDLPFTFER